MQLRTLDYLIRLCQIHKVSNGGMTRATRAKFRNLNNWMILTNNKKISMKSFLNTTQ